MTEHLAQALKEAGLDYCHISLNGSTEEIHCKSRSAFYDTLHAIQLLNQASIPCIINWVATHDNAADLPEMVRLAKNLEVERIDILMNKMSNVRDVISPCTREDLSLIKHQYDANSDILNIENCFIFLRILTQGIAIPLIDKGCLAGRFHMAVNARGEFMPCAHMKLHSASVSSISEYWEHDPVLVHLRTMSKESADACAACKFVRHCNPCYALEGDRLQNLIKHNKKCDMFCESNK